MDGSNVREGRVEICINQAWGTICNEIYGVTDARVICSDLNFSQEGWNTPTQKCASSENFVD